MNRGFLVTAAMLAALLGASPALAESNGHARIVACGSSDCLRVSGHRAGPDAQVRINGRAVRVDGARNWKVLLPVARVREWSKPGARSIAITTQSPGSVETAENQIDLPIGMLGSITELAYLVIPGR